MSYGGTQCFFVSALTFECNLVKDEVEFQPAQVMVLVSLHNF